jgi:hypothetical protein
MTQREHDDPIDALKAELAAVSPSPEFHARVRQRIAGELDLLRDELAAVAPSPEFAVRVRQGISEVDAARADRAASWLSGWRWVVPAGALAAGVIAVIALTRSGADAPERVTVQAAGPAPIVAQTPKPVVKPSATSNVEVRTPKLARSVAGARGEATPATLATPDPMLEVITNQPAILRAMYARISAGSSVFETTTIPDTVPDIVVAPIEISPIVVKSVVEPPAVGGAQPIIRRITADTAERSQK